MGNVKESVLAGIGIVTAVYLIGTVSAQELKGGKYHGLITGDKISEYNDLIMLANRLICIHPESGNRLIEISYSSRNSSGKVPQIIKNRR